MGPLFFRCEWATSDSSLFLSATAYEPSVLTVLLLALSRPSAPRLVNRGSTDFDSQAGTRDECFGHGAVVVPMHQAKVRALKERGGGRGGGRVRDDSTEE